MDARYLRYSLLHKVYATPKGPLTVVEDFNPILNKGEFVSLIWVDKVYPKSTRTERQEVVEYYLERVGLADAMNRAAADMSNGMRQRVSIARAFALAPKFLLLDEPFGMLDSLTRWERQEVLMEVSRTKVTAVCASHDVDEAILLADRVVMMTNGPRATIVKITEVKLPRPPQGAVFWSIRITIITAPKLLLYLTIMNMFTRRRTSPDETETGCHRGGHGLGAGVGASDRAGPGRVRHHADQRQTTRKL